MVLVLGRVLQILALEHLLGLITILDNLDFEEVLLGGLDLLLDFLDHLLVGLFVLDFLE